MPSDVIRGWSPARVKKTRVKSKMRSSALSRTSTDTASRWRMFGILGLGFLLGMQHALEADHIAAVSSIAARRSHVADIVKHGLTWGLGHTLTLFVFAGAAILLGRAIPESVDGPIETAVGVMLIGMGALSILIAVPLAVAAHWLTWANRGLQGAVGLATIVIGIITVVETVLA